MTKTPEVIKELKEYVFAQYYGRAYNYKNEFGKFGGNAVFGNINTIPHLQTAVMPLRGLSSITGDEAMYISKTWGAYNATDKQHAIVGKRFIDTMFELNNHSGSFIMSLYQYLQQLGFALPIFYKGTHYTVEQLTELGIYAPFK